MTIVSKKGDEIILKLGSGEELIGSLKKFAEKEKISGAWFTALGAAGDITLAFYDLNKKKYIEKRYKMRTEILNITGNIARLRFAKGYGKASKNDEIIIHAHGTFGKPDYSVIGGHIVSCRISATCEIYMKKLRPLARKHDLKTGLNQLTNRA